MPPRSAPTVRHVPTAHRQPASRGAPLRGHVAADVVVVGAGIVGVSAAVQLAARGADVALVTADHVGDGVTGRSSAKVTALHQVVYADLADRHGAGAAATYARACGEAIAWLRESAGDVWEERTAVTVARTPEEVAVLRREELGARAAGLPVRLVEGAVVDWPGAIAGLRLKAQGQVDPVALLLLLLDTAPAGIRLFERTRVTGLHERPGGARVTAEGGSAAAPHVLVATGLPIFDRSGFFGLCEPQASYVVAVAHDDGPPSGAGDMMITAGDPTRSVRWATDGGSGRRVLLVGGEGHRTGTGQPVTPRYDRLEAWARDTYDGLGDVVARWSAEDFMSPDRLPWAGPHHRLGGPVQVVTGLSKWGMTLGVACASAVVRRIDGRPDDDASRLFATARLPDLPGVGTVLRANADVARHLAAGWVGALARGAGDPVEGEGRVGRGEPVPRARCRVAGEVHDVSAVCPHLGGIVTWNDGDRTWDCPLHGSRFAHDGDVRHGPATRGLG